MVSASLVDASRGTASYAQDETSPLLQPTDHIAQADGDSPVSPEARGRWQVELKFIATNSSFLILASILYYSLSVTGMVVAGRIGPAELGAASLANVTANVFGLVIFQGLATTLDTLCAQAYGSGNFRLVGLHVQRMTCLLWCTCVPIGVIWFNASIILRAIIPDQEVAELTGVYLRVLILGAPGIALFESVKRYIQAQGYFAPILYALSIAAVANAFLSWLLVMRLSLGFIGVPLAIVTTYNLLPLVLIIYAALVPGRKCWPGLSRALFHNWMPMIALAIPGVCMIEAEFLAFEILTLAASYFSTKHLAAQTIIASFGGILWQFPFPTSIVATTRIAEWIGAGNVKAAKLSAMTATAVSLAIGMVNCVICSSPVVRRFVLSLFTTDQEVADLVAGTLPVLASLQIFDATGANGGGILRALGRQRIGGYVSLGCYYIFALPFSFFTAFHLGWELRGLWIGVTMGLAMVVVLEAWYLLTTDWQTCVEDAEKRNLGTRAVLEAEG